MTKGPAVESIREFTFDQRDFERVRASVFKIAGIRLADSKVALVYSRLARRLRALKLHTFSDYLNMVDKNADEQEQFVNALTTNLTSFFRESHHFDALAAHLRQHPETRAIWCAASSTGQEPYSIAMVVAEVFGSFTPPVKIFASDIDSKVLATAANGIYPAECTQQLSAERQKAFFYKGKGANSGKVRVAKEIRNMVEFRQINLTSPDYGLNQTMDVIFCRNVMIYFDRDTQAKVLNKLVGHLKPDGLYFAGHSEHLSFASHMIKPVGKTIYAKR